MFLLDAMIDLSISLFSATVKFPETTSPSMVRLLKAAKESELPPSAAGIDGPHSAKLRDLSWSGRPDHQNAVRSRQPSCPLVEDQEKLDRDAGRIFEQIRAVRRSVGKSSKGHPDRQARNFAGLQLVGADRHKRGLGKRQSLFGIGSAQEILEPLLRKRRFLRIWPRRHKGIVIRAERRARGTLMLRTGCANQTNQRDKEEGPFHGAGILKFPSATAQKRSTVIGGS
jgi:hypothetical protein